MNFTFSMFLLVITVSASWTMTLRGDYWTAGLFAFLACCCLFLPHAAQKRRDACRSVQIGHGVKL